MHMQYYLDIVVRLALAGIFGGIIGYERESIKRPAGFRTHILVCVGAALVMVTSEYIFDKYHSFSNADPARLGAQVISGIGFLGAGTIIRDGVNVKGLTTAATLWAVSCIGIATGIGFFSGAIAATMIIFFALISLKNVERGMYDSRRFKTIFIQTEYEPIIGDINKVLENYDVFIKTIELRNNKDKGMRHMKFIVRFHDSISNTVVVEELMKLTGVVNAYMK